MLYIRPVTSEDNLPEFLEAFRQGKLAYLALSGKERVGHILYHKEGDMLSIEQVQAEDEGLFDGLIRAVCDAAVQSGLPAVRFEPQVDRKILASLGVPLDEDGILHNLSAFLHNCAHCKLC